ncbi:NADH-quinone oxidoreductase subunit NuoE family protein [Qingrenia yutianensis]|uniref:NAD(P)H-dependent oxidoreductase subunit E n=1 Tax=Qingrenia yutianensis TaxID=2763676 RepID=A0A926ITX9_9FIRM|nr:NAD(P)H-dependent oxidoreductase subunit E [Qingrenia yutianensis]MBC8597045.1 NAD(P)H-dependent oxidoreductase subunit E [Qingrenia yutianensis]
MSEKKTPAFKGTKEQESELLKVIEKYKGTEGALIPTLHEAQEIYGYLPVEVQQIISDGLGISMAEIYGVVTFYTQFTTNPKGRYKIAVCLGTACYVKGSGDILEKIMEKLGIGVGECSEDGKYSLDATRCIGACGLAPVMTVNDDVYGRLVPDDVEGILAKYVD